jgi:CBS domain-containing protein
MRRDPKVAQSIRDVMTQNPECVSGETTVADAAKLMRDKDFGGILAMDGGQVSGFLTDRDIAIRVVAEGKDPNRTSVSDVATTDLHTLSPDDSVDDAIKLVREHNVRRVPVVEGAKPVGIVSIGDLALERDKNSALADLSGAAPNN